MAGYSNFANKSFTIMDKKPGDYLIGKLALAPLRQSPSELAELESQVLFGEKVIVHQKGIGDWIKVQSINDHYTGWTDQKMFETTDMEQGNYLLIEPIAAIQTEKNYSWLPFGSFISEDIVRLNTKNQFTLVGQKNTLNIKELALTFLGVPYLWGGKSVLGIDCSGFIQLIFNAKGIQLARNANQQAEAGEVIPYMNRQTGDLAFFKTTSNKISHVGIVIDDLIIHAHGEVRMDPLWSEGIFNTDKNLISHQLVGIKRIKQLTL